jgi:hypothetical protein
VSTSAPAASAVGSALGRPGWEIVDAGWVIVVDAGWEMVVAGWETVVAGGEAATTGSRRGNDLVTPILCGGAATSADATSADAIGAAATSRHSNQRRRHRGFEAEDSIIFTESCSEVPELTIEVTTSYRSDDRD